MSEKSDAIQSLEGKISDKRSQLVLWRGLVEHPGWNLFGKLLASQVDMRKGEILLRPLKNLDEVCAQEFMKGEVSGLSLSQVTAYSVIETLQAEIRTLEFNLENENAKADAYPSDAGGSRVDNERFYTDG